MKFKSELLLPPLRRIVPNKPDPTRLITGDLDEAEFSRCVSSICIDGVWRTTRPGRHPEANRLLAERVGRGKPIVALDVGVSDGATSIDLLQAMNDRIGMFFATDMCVSLRCVQHEGMWYLYRPDPDVCVMAVSKRLIYYRPGDTTADLVARSVTRVLEAAPSQAKGRDLSLMNPHFTSMASIDSRLRLKEWNVFSPWVLERVEVIRIANLLNPAYFTVRQLRDAVTNSYRALVDEGWIMIVDNRQLEKATLLRKHGDRLGIADRIGNGSDAEIIFGDGWQPAA